MYLAALWESRIDFCRLFWCKDDRNRAGYHRLVDHLREGFGDRAPDLDNGVGFRLQ